MAKESKNTLPEPQAEELALLESTDALFLLRYLNRHPLSLQADIISSSGNNKRTKLVRLKELSDAGLIKTVKDLTTGKAILYSLTKAGEKVVKRLDQINEVFEKYDIGKPCGKFYNDRSIIVSGNDMDSTKKQIEREVEKNSIKSVYVRSEYDAKEIVEELMSAFPDLYIDVWRED